MVDTNDTVIYQTACSFEVGVEMSVMQLVLLVVSGHHGVSTLFLDSALWQHGCMPKGDIVHYA